jgi:opacity protein-like surface antigen
MGFSRLVVAAIVLVSAATARAQSSLPPGAFAVGDRYVSVKLGAAMPQHDDLDGFNTGLATEVSIGQRFHRNFAGEFNLGFSSMSTDTETFNLNGTLVNAKGSAYFIPITATFKVIAPLGNVELYGLGGAGLYVGRMTFDAASSFASASDSDTSTGAGLHFGAGTVIQLSPRASLSAELRYHVAEATFFDATGRIDNIQLMGGFAFRP